MKLLSKTEVGELIGLHPESVMRLSRDGKFPRPIKMGPEARCAVRFIESEIGAWVAERAKART